MKKIIIAISAFVLILNNSPLILGVINQKGDLVFLGRRDINSQDLYTYLSFIQQGKDGRILFKNLYMSEAQKPRLLRPSYIIIGKAAWLFNLSHIWAYHLARLAASVIFMTVLWWFLKQFFEDNIQRIVAYSLILTSAGFGLFFGKWASNSADLWIPEAITFLSLAEAPHFILAQILMIGGFALFLRARYIFASLAFLALAFEHPFNLAVVAAAVLATAIWQITKDPAVQKLRLVKGLSIILLMVGLGVAYQIWEINQNQVLQSWAAQNKLLSPDPLAWFVGYGAIILFAMIGAEKFLKEARPGQILILSWIGATAVLLYSPIFFQRRFSEGLHIPLGIIAASGVLAASSLFTKYIIPKAKAVLATASVLAIILFLALSSARAVANDIAVIQRDNPGNYYYHLLKSEMAGLAWLKGETNQNDVIAANWFYGNLIPGIIGRKVYLGHKVQTPFFDQKVENVNKFLLNKNSNEAHQFLKENGITYIFLGKNDTMLNYGFKPYEKPYLTDVYNKNDVLIFKVKN